MAVWVEYYSTQTAIIISFLYTISSTKLVKYHIRGTNTPAVASFLPFGFG